MVIVEFAPNDSFMEADARMDAVITPDESESEEHTVGEPTGRGGDDGSGERTVQFYTEALVRQILQVRPAHV